MRNHLFAMLSRWRWVAGAGVAGAVLAVLLAGLSAPAYRSTAVLYVGAARLTEAADPAYATQVTADVLPSLVELARSAAVLTPIVDELRLTESAGTLAGRVSAVGDADSALLMLTVDAGTPDQATRVAAAVAESLAGSSARLYADQAGVPLLRVETIRAASEPQFPTAPARSTAAALGLLGGAGAGALLAGITELLRPRVRDARDVTAVTDLPVLAELRRRPRLRSVADRTDRDATISRLRWLLRSSPTGPVTSIVTVAAAPGTPDDQLVAELSAGPAGAGDADGVVVVVQSGRTTPAGLRDAVAEAQASGAPVLGVVVDGLPADPTGWRSRLRSAAGVGPEGSAPAGRPAWRTADGLTALAAVLVVGASRPLPMSLSTGLLVVVALFPVWVRAVARYRAARLLGLLTGLGLVCGWLLAARSAVDHDFALHEALSTTTVVCTTAGTVGLLLWARTVAPVPLLGAAYGLGLLAVGLVHSAGTADFYKFQVSLPLTVLVLSLASAARRPAVTLVALAVLGSLDIAHDSRSAFGFCMLAAALVLWQARSAARPPRDRRLLAALLLPALGYGAYAAISELLVSGALGAEVAQRTSTQIAQSGSLLLGGRPEWTATWALMQHDWAGAGLGTVPTAADIAVARSGIASTRIPTVEGYLENYLFAGRFELHSIVADLWTNLGLAGLLLGVAVAAVLLRSAVELIGLGRASGLVCFLTLRACWDLTFSPLPANAPYVALALGLLLVPVAGWAGRDGSAATRTAQHEPATDLAPATAGAPPTNGTT